MAEIRQPELDFLFQLSRTFAQKLPLSTMLQTILKQLAFITGIDEATVVVTLPDLEPLTIGTRRRTLSALQREVMDRVSTSHQPLAITNTGKPSESGEIAFSQKELPSRALLAVPLYVGEQSLGLLYLYQRKPLPFSYAHFIFYNEVASRLADHIENQRLITEITQKEQQLSAIIEHSGEGIAVLDHDQKIVIWNAALEQLTGITSEEAVDQPCTILHPLIVAGQCPLERKQHYTEHLFRHAHARHKRYVAVISSSVEISAGKMNRIFLFRDVSKAKQLEEAKNDFMSLATHQLRTPLTAILGYLSMLSAKDTGSLNPDQGRFLERIQEASHRLSSLVEDLLHVMRLEEGRLAIDIQPVDVGSLVNEVIPDFLSAGRHKGLSLTIKGTEQLTVFADPKWIKHSLINLIDNAIKYTPPGGKINIRWEHGFFEGQAMGAIHIHDTGIGIAREEQHIAFQKFGRLGSNPINVSGSGLGLYIAKQLVEKQGGFIWVKSARGKGSTFSLVFPLAYQKRRLKVRPRKEGDK